MVYFVLKCRKDFIRGALYYIITFQLFHEKQKNGKCNETGMREEFIRKMYRGYAISHFCVFFNSVYFAKAFPTFTDVAPRCRGSTG